MEMGAMWQWVSVRQAAASPILSMGSRGDLAACQRALPRVAFGVGRFVAVGAGGKIYTSIDGQVWTEATTGVANDLSAVRFGGDVFVAVGANGQILTSPDGLAWRDRTPPGETANFMGVAQLNGVWCVNSVYGVWTSTNTMVWERVSNSPSYLLWMGKAGGCFLLPQWAGPVALSENGSAWANALVIDPDVPNWGAVAEGNGTVVVVGSGGAIYQTRPFPVLGTHPVNRTVNDGQTAVFTVVASKNPAASLQWQRKPRGSSFWSDLANDARYNGVTTSKLTVAADALMNSDAFRCIASNSEFSVASNAAVLTVYGAPVITSQPASKAVTEGDVAALTVTVIEVPRPTLSMAEGLRRHSRCNLLDSRIRECPDLGRRELSC